MLDLGLYDTLIILALASIGACFVAVVVWVAGRATHRVKTRRTLESFAPTFLFDGEELVDSTPDARLLISAAPSKMTRREATVFAFRERFPTLGDDMLKLEPGQSMRVLPADDSSMWLELTEISGRIRLSLNGSRGDTSAAFSNSAVQESMVTELNFLRTVAEFTPQQIWQQDAKGKLLWANHAYLATSDQMIGASDKTIDAWPDRPLFENLHHDVPETKPVHRRLSVKLPDATSDSWFDVASLREGETTLHFATDANGTVLAEQSRNKLLQTLSKTFAHLSIGLAIFDHKRQMTIFNPALLDLTRMSAEFLSSRPTVDMFLDNLREARLLPEPKNYASWREQFKALEDAARDGSYSENWNLPDGLTYRVTGKPHADGAFAFFFEDISAEVSLTRRFRTDIETGQNVLDTLPDAITVFSSNGTLVMSNKAYEDLWDLSDDTMMGRHDIRQELAVWRRKCAASPIWTELRDFVGTMGERDKWEETAVLDDGRQIECVAKPIPGGMTMVTFTFMQPTRPVIQMLTRTDPSLLVNKR
jgi:PAS domain-containing protein